MNHRSMYLVLLSLLVSAGSTEPLSAGTIVGATTAEANNDNYVGEFDDSPNSIVFNSNEGSATISTLETVFGVLDSGSTTEYALRIAGAYNSEIDPPLTEGYRLQLGFGTGANFVPAASVVPGLDFDAPLPASPQPTTGPLPLVSHTADTLTMTGGPFSGSFFMSSLFKVPVDVPDLPDSVMDYYSAEDLPEGFPDGAKPFTVKGAFLPEPSTVTLLVAAGLCLLGCARRRKNKALTRKSAVLVALGFALFLGGAGGAARAGTLEVGATSNPNNDDHTGTFNSNSFGYLIIGEINGDRVLAVFNSGGTTEYKLTDAFLGMPPGITECRLELGFGKGDQFVSAFGIVPDLDFDAPLPGDPAPTSDVFAQIDHYPYLVNFYDGEAGMGYTNVALWASMDIPDLPPSVMDYYLPGDLKDTFPDGALPFTLRRHEGLGIPVPEPTTLASLFSLVAAGLLALMWRQRKK